MLTLHWIIVAFLCAVTVERTYVAASLSFIVTLSFWSVNYIAVELEMPFGDDPNDLPLHSMQRDLNRSLKGLMHPRALCTPHYDVADWETTETMSVAEINFDSYVSQHVNKVQRQKFTKTKKAKKQQSCLDLSETRPEVPVKLGAPKSSVGSTVVSVTDAPEAEQAAQRQQIRFSPSSETFLPKELPQPSSVDTAVPSPDQGFTEVSDLTDSTIQVSGAAAVPTTVTPASGSGLARSNSGRLSLQNSSDRQLELIRLNLSMDGTLGQMLKELQLISGSQGVDLGGRMPLLSLLPPSEACTQIEQREPKALESSSSCGSCRL
jgi:hypothetical protein